VNDDRLDHTSNEWESVDWTEGTQVSLQSQAVVKTAMNHWFI